MKVNVSPKLAEIQRAALVAEINAANRTMVDFCRRYPPVPCRGCGQPSRLANGVDGLCLRCLGLILPEEESQ